LKTEDAGFTLSSINLEKLQRDFNVYGISGNTQTQIKKGRQVKSQTLILTLYPLRTGKLQLPVLAIKGNSTRPLSVTVNAFGKHAPRVLIKTTLDTVRLQVRQEATLVLEIFDDSNLVWTAPREIIAATAHQKRLAETQRQEELDGTRYTVHRYAWAVMPLREGGFAVEFPMVDASVLGKRLRYAVPPLWLDAAPVPAYLPVHVPIGKPDVSLEALPGEIELERPVNLTLTVKGAGISAEGLGKMLSSVRSSAAFHFYPARISDAGKGRSETAGQTVTISLPFVPLKTGSLQLPDLNFPYYDPVSARVETVFVAGRMIEVFNPVWRVVIKTALVLILLGGVTALGYWLIKKLQRMIKVRKILQAIGNAQGGSELSSALLRFGADKTFGSCRTLQQWLHQMRLVYIVDAGLAEAVQKISRAQYGNDSDDQNVAVLARDISGKLKILRSRKMGAGKVMLQNTMKFLYPERRTP